MRWELNVQSLHDLKAPSLSKLHRANLQPRALRLLPQDISCCRVIPEIQALESSAFCLNKHPNWVWSAGLLCGLLDKQARSQAGVCVCSWKMMYRWFGLGGFTRWAGKLRYRKEQSHHVIWSKSCQNGRKEKGFGLLVALEAESLIGVCYTFSLGTWGISMRGKEEEQAVGIS